MMSSQQVGVDCHTTQLVSSLVSQPCTSPDMLVRTLQTVQGHMCQQQAGISPQLVSSLGVLFHRALECLTHPSHGQVVEVVGSVTESSVHLQSSIAEWLSTAAATDVALDLLQPLCDPLSSLMDAVLRMADLFFVDTRLFQHWDLEKYNGLRSMVRKSTPQLYEAAGVILWACYEGLREQRMSAGPDMGAHLQEVLKQCCSLAGVLHSAMSKLLSSLYQLANAGPHVPAEMRSNHNLGLLWPPFTRVTLNMLPQKDEAGDPHLDLFPDPAPWAATLEAFLGVLTSEVPVCWKREPAKMRKWVNFLRLNVLEHLLEYAGALPPSSWSTLVKVAQEMHALAVAPPAEPAFAAENVATLHSKLSPTLTRVMLKVMDSYGEAQPTTLDVGQYASSIAAEVRELLHVLCSPQPAPAAAPGPAQGSQCYAAGMRGGTAGGVGGSGVAGPKARLMLGLSVLEAMAASWSSICAPVLQAASQQLLPWVLHTACVELYEESLPAFEQYLCGQGLGPPPQGPQGGSSNGEPGAGGASLVARALAASVALLTGILSGRAQDMAAAAGAGAQPGVPTPSQQASPELVALFDSALHDCLSQMVTQACSPHPLLSRAAGEVLCAAAPRLGMQAAMQLLLSVGLLASDLAASEAIACLQESGSSASTGSARASGSAGWGLPGEGSAQAGQLLAALLQACPPELCQSVYHELGQRAMQQQAAAAAAAGSAGGAPGPDLAQAASQALLWRSFAQAASACPASSVSGEVQLVQRLKGLGQQVAPAQAMALDPELAGCSPLAQQYSLALVGWLLQGLDATLQHLRAVSPGPGFAQGPPWEAAQGAARAAAGVLHGLHEQFKAPAAGGISSGGISPGASFCARSALQLLTRAVATVPPTALPGLLGEQGPVLASMRDPGCAPHALALLTASLQTGGPEPPLQGLAWQRMLGTGLEQHWAVQHEALLAAAACIAVVRAPGRHDAGPALALLKTLLPPLLMAVSDPSAVQTGIHHVLKSYCAGSLGPAVMHSLQAGAAAAGPGGFAGQDASALAPLATTPSSSPATNSVITATTSSRVGPALAALRAALAALHAHMPAGAEAGSAGAEAGGPGASQPAVPGVGPNATPLQRMLGEVRAGYGATRKQVDSLRSAVHRLLEAQCGGAGAGAGGPGGVAGGPLVRTPADAAHLRNSLMSLGGDLSSLASVLKSLVQDLHQGAAGVGMPGVGGNGPPGPGVFQYD